MSAKIKLEEETFYRPKLNIIYSSSFDMDTGVIRLLNPLQTSLVEQLDSKLSTELKERIKREH